MTRPPPISTLFPYTTLFRSDAGLDSPHLRLSHCSVHIAASCRSPRTLADRWNDDRRAIAGRLDPVAPLGGGEDRSEEHTSELQSLTNLVCRLLLEKKKQETS